MLDRIGPDHIADKSVGTSPLFHEVTAALDRIIASTEFKASPHLAAFLRFSVEKTLAGEGPNIKAYSVATGVLGRPPTFDPQADPIVRVEATRLRRALERYYLHEGHEDPILIDIPRGRYIAYFSYRDERQDGTDASHSRDDEMMAGIIPRHDVASAAGSARAYLRKIWSDLNIGERRSISVFAVALVGAVVTWGAMPLWEQSRKPIEQALMLTPAPVTQATTSEGLGTQTAGLSEHVHQRVIFATLQLTPFDTYSDHKEHHELSHRLTHLVAERAPDFEGIPVIDPDGPMASDPPHDHLYSLMGTILQEPGRDDRIEISVRLVERPSYEIIWTKKYISESGLSLFDPELLTIRDDIVQSIAGLNGAIRVDDARRHVENTMASLPCQMCLAESDLALRTGDSERIGKAVSCLTALAEKMPNEALIFKQLAALRMRDSQTAIERVSARASARRDLETALSLAPTDHMTRERLNTLRSEN